MAFVECRKQFKWRRWDCSTTNNIAVAKSPFGEALTGMCSQFHSSFMCVLKIMQFTLYRGRIQAVLSTDFMLHVQQEPWRLPSRQAEFNVPNRLRLNVHSDYQAVIGNQGYFED